MYMSTHSFRNFLINSFRAKDSELIITCVGEVGVAAVVGRRCERPFLRRLKDSRSDFLNDFRREIGVSPAPE